MKMRKPPVVEEVVDPTAWMLDSGFAEFLLMNTYYIKYMCMFGYTFMHGAKLFPSLPSSAATSFKFVSMIFQCTGGGILVPIFINSIPVPLSTDAYPIAITTSFLLHFYFPILRDVMKYSPILKVAMIILYETMRASVVIKLTAAAGAAIAPSDFDVAVFGPVFCGAVAGCGGAFLPLNKGLDPIKDSGLAQPMLSALIGAAFYHFFINTSLSEGVVDAAKKAHVVVTCFFIAYHIYSIDLKVPVAKAPAKETKKTK